MRNQLLYATRQRKLGVELVWRGGKVTKELVYQLSSRDDTNRGSREIHSGQYEYSHSIWTSMGTNACVLGVTEARSSGNRIREMMYTKKGVSGMQSNEIIRTTTRKPATLRVSCDEQEEEGNGRIDGLKYTKERERMF